MIVIGGVEDQLGLIVWGLISRLPFLISNPSIANYDVYTNLFNGLMHPYSTSMPIIWTFMSICLSAFGPNFLNIFFIATVCLNFAVSSLYFKRYKYGIYYALIFTFCTYFYIHAGVHPDLIQLWLIPAFLLAYNKLLEKGTLKQEILVGSVLAVSLIISNYIGYMLFVFFLCLNLVEFLLKMILDKKIDLKVVKSAIVVVLTYIVLVITLLYPYIQANYFKPKEETSIDTKQVVRSIDDFVEFSSRPWYFFIPPIKNPMLGSLGTSMIEKIQSTGYYLADDYFPKEHSANYFGFMLIFSTVVLTFKAWKKADKVYKRSIVSMFITITLIMLFMLPPTITIAGITVYTPGFLLYKFFPMFRVTARFSIIILICILHILNYAVSDILKNKLSNKLTLIMTIIVIVTLVETFVPIKLYRLPSPPQVFIYLRTSTPVGTTFSVYPYSYTDETLLWLNEHQRVMINPRAYIYKEMNSEDFTKNLNTDLGLQSLKKYNSNYLIVFKDKTTDFEFFSKSSYLKLVKEFQESVLFEVVK